MVTPSTSSSNTKNDGSQPELRRPQALPVFSPPIQQEIDNHDTAITITDAARIAIHDTPGAAPRVIIVEPSDIRTYIENITVHVYNEAKQMGGKIAYMVIREAVENYIHAYFREPIITILDNGNTIRFTDQGPGISDPDLVTQPGITSATKEMKSYIRGSGSGLPIIKENLQISGGTLYIHQNVGAGACITLTLNTEACEQSCHLTQDISSYEHTEHVMQHETLPISHTRGYINTSVQQPYGYVTQQMYHPIPQPVQYVHTSAQEVSQPTIHQDTFEILSVIKKYKKGGPTLIAQHCNMSVATACRRIKTLVDQGYVMKENRKVILSPAGHRLLEQLYR